MASLSRKRNNMKQRSRKISCSEEVVVEKKEVSQEDKEKFIAMWEEHRAKAKERK